MSDEEEYEDGEYPIEWHYWKPCPACSMPIRSDQYLCDECADDDALN